MRRPDPFLPLPPGQAHEQARLAALLEAMAGLWFVVDADGRVVQASQAEHALLGLPCADLYGRPLGHGMTDAIAERCRTARKAALAGGEVQRFEAELEGRDGVLRAFEASVAALGAGDVLFLVQDVTERRARERQLRDRQAAEIANRAKSAFLSRVSHEMRTPLNAVIGFTQLLRLAPEGAGPAQVGEFTDHVLRASQHLLALINDLLDLQRVEEDRLVLDLQPLALQPLVGAAFELLRPLARQHGVILRNEVGADGQVLADAQRLRQVLFNVVSNAIKYNRPGGWVRVAEQASDDGRLAFVVEDTGAGLSPAEAARLFEPFERLGRETTEIEGVGLGLVIARRLVEAMGGAIELGARPDAPGTAVRIALPLATPPAAEETAEPASALRMLYVEDNRINAILFEEAMRLRGGIELKVAEDGAEALALADGWTPEVLVLDANLPDMTGFDVLERLRARPALAAVPAYMCSADAMDADLQRAAAAGFAGYWTKPIDIARVLSDLEPLLAASPPRAR